MTRPETDHNGTRWWTTSLGQRRGPKATHRGREMHRVNGPAIEFPNGGKYWYQHGNLHREGGPAIEFPSGTKQWWRKGQFLSQDPPSGRTP